MAATKKKSKYKTTQNTDQVEHKVFWNGTVKNTLKYDFIWLKAMAYCHPSYWFPQTGVMILSICDYWKLQEHRTPNITNYVGVLCAHIKLHFSSMCTI